MELLASAEEAGTRGVIHLASSEGRATRLAQILWRLSGEIDAMVLPPWDSLPYDRVSPSAAVMGLRIAALSRLAEGLGRPWIVLATAEATLQRLPPPEVWRPSTLTLSVGDAIDPEALAASLHRTGYRDDERVDEPGEFAARGAVIDVFPAGYGLPVRLSHADGVLTALHSFDAASQRTSDGFDTLTLRPVSEAVLTDTADPPIEREPGLEQRLPELYERLSTLFDYAPDALLTTEPAADERAQAFLDQIRDAHDSRLRFDRDGARPLPPDRLYLDRGERDRLLASRTILRFAEPEEDGADVPNFALGGRPYEALARFAAVEREGGRRVAIAGANPREVASVTRRLERALDAPSRPASSWAEAQSAPAGALLTMALPITAGFKAGDVTVVAVADVLGSAASTTLARAAETGVAAFDDAAETLRLGDGVIHLKHGVGVLEGLEAVDAGIGEPTDTIRLVYAKDAKLMAPVAEVELMWRYGSGDALKLDRLDGTSWPKRRAKVEAEIGEAARRLATLAAERRAVEAPVLAPLRRDYERFVAGFPYAETGDQLAAVADILADLRSGRPMDRLVCGDVGFGKTEVALRAAAAAALGGKQVAVVAPTTVLVRQHLETFRRRFAEVGIAVAHLSRLVTPAEARDVKAGLAEGRIRVVIGTHALAGKGVAFDDLGLLVIDEEQRFDAADKAKLRGLGDGVHVLTMTATPIPRTLQSALAGLQDVSILATPPAERVPVRTVVTPFDPPSVREALKRERRRGGQSFVVCPQIEDLEPMGARLRELVPELDVAVAHGKLPAAELDDVMVRFAGGGGDVLLATNIIESGLDVPRANTVLIWRADRFGLSQLHQLRGRVGRGRARGLAYLLTEPEAELAESTTKRLETLASLDRLGAGFAVGAEDLEQRGAGDLLGDKQAGHVKLIGSGLYRRLLERALVIARGETPPDDWTPELNVGVEGRIPGDYVPEPEVRLNLYAAVARTRDEAGEARLREEIEDRFGPPPPAIADLLLTARLRRLCRDAAIARVDAGPQGIALTFKERRGAGDLPAALSRFGPTDWREGRLVFERATADSERAEVVEDLLLVLADA